MNLFGEKKYTINKTQLDKMNQVYNDMKAENEKLKGIKEKDDLLFDYEQEVIRLQDENKRLTQENKKLKKHIVVSESTMSAVLQKLDSTMRTAETSKMVVDLYKEMNDYNKDPIMLSNSELPFLKQD